VSLQRFHDAQDDPIDGFATALAEITSGAKRGHWIWYVLPQLKGLGQSAMSVQYGIEDEAEAVAYLRDRTLRERLVAIVTALASHRHHTTLVRVMGSRLDATKVMSSMTLFREIATRLHAAGECAECAPLARAADGILEWGEGDGLTRCAFTLARVSG
jgi:uncharacterized protein (DUF1810 family)